MEREVKPRSARVPEVAAGPISEVSLENSVDTEASRLEQKIGSFTASLERNPFKAKSFLDRLRERSSFRSILALMVGIHLAGVDNNESLQDSSNPAVAMSHAEYEKGVRHIFEFNNEFFSDQKSSDQIDSQEETHVQEYAPSYEARQLPQVVNDVKFLQSFLQKNSFPKYVVTVIGFASFEGDSSKNEKLSQERANLAFVEIQSALEAAGVDVKNIDWQVEGHGEHIELNGHKISESEAYDYLRAQLGVSSNVEVDKKIIAFNDGKFDHPALQDLLVKMRGHRVIIEGVGEPIGAKPKPKKKILEVTEPGHAVLYPGETPPKQKNFAPREDAMLRLPRRKKLESTQRDELDLDGEDTQENEISFEKKDLEKTSLDVRTLERGHEILIDMSDFETFENAPLEKRTLERSELERSPLDIITLERAKALLERSEVKENKQDGAKLDVATLERGKALVRERHEVRSSEVIDRATLERGKEIIRTALEKENSKIIDLGTLERGKKILLDIRESERLIRELLTLDTLSRGRSILRGLDRSTLETTRLENTSRRTPEVYPPKDPPLTQEELVSVIKKNPRGANKEVQSMRVRRRTDRDEQYYKKQPLHGGKSKTGREAVVLDSDLNAAPLPKMIHNERQWSRGAFKKDRSPKAQRQTTNRRATRKLIAKNETSEPTQEELADDTF